MVYPVFSSVEKWRWRARPDQGNLMKILGIHWEKVDPHRGEHLLGRTAHSARNEETIHDRTVKPASENVQRKADFEKFIMGSETTEFVNKGQKPSANSTEKNVKQCRGLYRTFNNLGNVYGYNIECSDIYEKEYSTMQNVVQNEENLTLKQMFDVTAQTIHNEEEIYCFGQNRVSEEFLDTTVID